VNPALYADLGRVRYGPALDLQRRLHSLRREGKIPDVVLSLEHEPVITIGRGGDDGHVLASRDELLRFGVEVVAIERGGDVTYHGPGQLVLYPILDLRERGKDLHRYVGELEEVMLRTARELGVEASRRAGRPGVWHGQGKLGSVGIHVRDWVTLHGLALNVDLRPNGFRWIVPCGIAGATDVSISDLVGRPVSIEAARDTARAAFADVFGVDLSPVGEEVIAAWTRGSRSG
jgi:lipoate-protein ligase B